MRKHMVLLASLSGMLAGCSSPQRTSCEAELLASLKAPSTYKRIGVEETRFLDSKPPYHVVDIEYDAENSFGAPLRDHFLCTYRLDANGKPTSERFNPFGTDPDVVSVSEAADALDAAGAAVDNAGNVVEAGRSEVAKSADYLSNDIDDAGNTESELNASDFDGE